MLVSVIVPLLILIQLVQSLNSVETGADIKYKESLHNAFHQSKQHNTDQSVRLTNTLAKLIADMHKNRKLVEKRGSNKDPEWTKWTDWSSCSVSCGKGRQIRWRNCISSCKQVDAEMDEKTCQLPACAEKLFGLIKV